MNMKFSTKLFQKFFLLLQETTRQENENQLVVLAYEFVAGEDMLVPERYQCVLCEKNYGKVMVKYNIASVKIIMKQANL